MGNLYPYVEAAVMAACLAVILFPVAALAQRRGIWPAMRWAAVGTGWFLLVWELARAGAFEGTRSAGRLTELVVILVPLLAGLLLLRRKPDALAQPADLVAIQTVRIVAVVVLVAFAGEALPAWLALPIGVGDTLLGLTALAVARRVRVSGPAYPAVWAWNAIGATMALYTMVAPVFSAHTTGYFFSLYPLVLFPTFLAPISLLLHVSAVTAPGGTARQ